MDDFVNLTTLSFLLAVVSFLVQVFDVFPRYRETRRDILLLTFGFFVGSLLSSLTGVSISIDGGGLTMGVAIAFVIITIGFLLAGIASDSRSRRHEHYTIASLSGLFLAFLIIPALDPPVSSSERLSFAERLVLARHNIKAGQIDRAIYQMEWARGMLPAEDQRGEILYREIKALEKQQFDKEFESINQVDFPSADIVVNKTVEPEPETPGAEPTREADPQPGPQPNSSQEAPPA